MSSHDRERVPRRPPARPALLLITAAVLLAGCSGSGPQSSLETKGPIAEDIDNLWLLVFWIATVVFIIVEAALVVSLIKWRRGKGEERMPVQTHGNTRLEVVWTIIPAVVLAVVAVPTIAGVFNIRSIPEGDDVLQVEVVGHQWWWEFRYPDFGIVTANELHIPEKTTVNLTMTSADVIHSFWVPPLNGKRDTVPGRTSNLTLEAFAAEAEPIPGQCAEFCGLAHADMRFKVFVDTGPGFLEWVSAQQAPAKVPTEGLAATGWEIFNQVCTACHEATVENPDGTVETVGVGRVNDWANADEWPEWALAPNLTHFGSRTTLGAGTFINDHPTLEAWLANPSDLKPMDPDRNDIASGRILGMPNFGLDDESIDALVALLDSWK